MAYIGSTPASGDFVLLDNLTASATASYTMQRNSVNFSPQSANHMIVSLNGTIQKPGSSFTISGSTITFASALTSSDAIDFILVLGNVNDVGVASSVVDSAITKNKTDFITDGSSAGVTVKGSGSDSGSIALNCSSNSHAIELISPDHSAGQSYKLKFPDNNVTADKFIKVKSITGSGATATGQLEFASAGDNSPIFYAHNQNSQTISNNTHTVVQFDTDSATGDFDPDSKFNTSNYRFTPAVSGYYLLYTQIALYDNSDFDNFRCTIRKNGSAIVRARIVHKDNGTINAMTIVNSDTDDYFDCEVYHDKGSNLSLTTGYENTYFTGFKVVWVI